MGDRPLVLVSGCFNIMHSGHVRLFEFANQYGSVTVGLNEDLYLAGKYGANAIPFHQRAYVVGSCRYVDQVVGFSEEDPSALIRTLKPSYYVRGPDYRGKQLPEEEAIKEAGCELVIYPSDKEQNGSDLVRWFPIGVDR